MSEPDVVVKLLGQRDARVFERVAADVFDGPVKHDVAREFLRDRRHHIAVAIDEGVVVGMATGVDHVHPDKRAHLFINEVGVAPSHRRRGLARALVTRLLEHARAIGCSEAWVATEEENTEARSLYRALGGREDPSRAVVYTYPLQEPSPARISDASDG